MTVIKVDAAVAYGRNTEGATMAPRTSHTRPSMVYTRAIKTDIKTMVHMNFLHNTIKILKNLLKKKCEI